MTAPNANGRSGPVPEPLATAAGERTVAVHYLGLLVDHATRRGLDVDSLLREGGVAPAAREDPNGRIPFTAFDRLCTLVAERLADPALGLHLGLGVRVGHLGSHGVALMSCATGRELMQQSTRYSTLSIDAAYNEMRIEGDACVRHWRSNLPDGRPLGRIHDELSHVMWVKLARWLVDREDVAPLWVSFRHARPEDERPYAEFFRCPIRFGAAETALGFDAALLDLKLPHANAQLHRVMSDLCAQLTRQLGTGHEPQWLALARRTVLESFRHGVPGLGAVAAAVNFTEDELKEALAARGLSFRGFVDELRQALALGYTRDPGLGLVDIAFLLGFSEQSAFQRAFKRWTGVTPGEYRRRPGAG